MEKQHKLIRPLPCGVFSIMVVFIVLFSGCMRNPEASHQMFINNTTNDSLHFQITRKNISEIPAWGLDLPPRQKRMLGNGAEHLEGEDITFQTIWENFGLSTDTVEILHKDTIIIKWGGPLRLMPDSINHFYNESSWEIRKGGIKNRWERGTFTIYESDLGNIEGK